MPHEVDGNRKYRTFLRWHGLMSLRDNSALSPLGTTEVRLGCSALLHGLSYLLVVTQDDYSQR